VTSVVQRWFAEAWGQLQRTTSAASATDAASALGRISLLDVYRAEAVLLELAEVLATRLEAAQQRPHRLRGTDRVPLRAVLQADPCGERSDGGADDAGVGGAAGGGGGHAADPASGAERGRVGGRQRVPDGAVAAVPVAGL
jgi:hypothetical protein